MTRAKWFRSWLLLAALLAGPSGAVAAEIRTGSAVLRYDETVWRATLLGAAIELVRVDAERLDMSFSVSQLPAEPGGSCEVRARDRLSLTPYDARSITSSPAMLGGQPATRFTAHTRCRNATPRGEVVCSEHKGRLTLVVSARYGCRGSPGGDPQGLAGILDGLRIEE